MANRATDADVEELLDVDASISLDPFIDAANALVTELCANSNYDDARLAMIEAWLSAHFYQMRDQAVTQEQAGSVRVQYAYKSDLFLNQTKYGQMAQMLDTSGNLAQLNKRMKDGESSSVVIGWLGEDYDTEDSDD